MACTTKAIIRSYCDRKRPEPLAAGPIILHDNAAAYVSRVTSLLARDRWETLPHPPYTPDLSPFDFDLFPRMKENMPAVTFED